MTATVIDPTAIPVVFEGWHRDGSDVTLYAVQVLAAYRMLGLAAKGFKFKACCRQPSPLRLSPSRQS